MRLPGAGWRVLLRDHELRIASCPDGSALPYAVTTRNLGGDVLVQIHRGWWDTTPAALRAAALARHAARVDAAVAALGSPADLFWVLTLGLRGGVVAIGSTGGWLGSGSLAGLLGVPEPLAAGMIWTLGLALASLRHALWVRLLGPVCRWQFRRWLRRHPIL